MAIPIRLTPLAAVLLAAVVSRDALAEIEVQTGRVVGERLGSGPVNYTADPFHKFDPIGGLRQLDRVLIDVGFDWECIVQLANPLPEPQEVRYNALPGFAYLPTNTDVDFTIERFSEPNGILIAKPFETVQRLHTTQFGPLTYYNLDPNEPFFQSMIGPGAIEFETLQFDAGFDTFRWLNGFPFPGPPIGFSVFREYWDISVTYTYEFTIVPTPSAVVPLICGLTMTGRSRRRPDRQAG